MKRKISIRTCIILAFSLILILLLGIVVLSFSQVNKASNMGKQLYNEYGQTQGEAGMGYAYFQEVRCNLRNTLYLYAEEPDKQADAIKAIESAVEKMYQKFDDAKNGMEHQEGLDLLEDTRDKMDIYVEDTNKCVEYVQAGQLDAARKHLADFGIATANETAECITKVIDWLENAASTALDDFQMEKKKQQTFLFSMLVISVLICVCVIAYLVKNIQKPVVRIAGVAKKIAVGEVNVELSQDCALREMDDLVGSFHQMTQNLQNQADVMNRISQGDLRAEITAHSQEDAVGVALSRLLRDDNQTFSTIRNATNQISHGSSQIAAASQTLAQGSTEQASAIEQIAASISDIAGKTKNNASQADEVNQIVLQAKEDVLEGNKRMQEMVSAMGEINEASENIQKIIKVIDDIAFNTNILALNATVEAARAGEQGKGFAVVAEEVRSLAGRSAEASSQTAEMIEDSIHKVKRGGELAQETAEALRIVSEMIEKITGLSEDIAKASNEQASATAQIDQALMQVSQVVQTNSATSQQCASASEELSGQAQGLEEELSRFQLKDVIGNMPSHTLEYSEPNINLLENNMKY